ncbi:hypothetical protein A3A70_01665 [candidate division WWE3 bacterium RIFCSPLOWO2_01_FULL_42_11]|uniref:AAA+ ATPase domain-containing protein n=1 Tax=candidate division WWE3 bacterium RIFCSPLOWO2_01_FULL_42_11 TaxID=1802627 RepID=A0A1F4VR39_UNCKA|nr:MAG: hypothetical protein A3A70_01665 [candidate division WWE3 bacterium RIFCSPLOWO2_01_FULL_42_11]
MGGPTNNNLETILKTRNLVSDQDLAAAKLEHINTGASLEDILIQRKVLDVGTLTKIKAEEFGIPFIDVNNLEIASYILDLIPETLAVKYQVLPFKEEGMDLDLAMADPLDLQTIAIIEKRATRRIKPFQADPSIIKLVIEQQYTKALGNEVTEALREVSADEEVGVTNIDAMMGTNLSTKNLEDAPVARIVGQILQYAIRTKASDIHIEPGEKQTRIRYRLDGVLVERLNLPGSIHENLVSRIKILSNLKIDEKRVPQDGRFKAQLGSTIIDLRISTLPTVYGEKVVMRLLEGTGKAIGINQLGLRGDGLRKFQANLDKTVGMILVTGPTGSGKTNTIAAALQTVNKPGVNIVTLEDPVEIRVPGTNQVQVNPQAGLTFASGLRSILRQDPNIIMVGEIRDFETAELAIHAALTGHLVFSTLHTKSAAAALPRLYDMHVEPFLLASTINMVIGQRLVRILCTACRKAHPVTDPEFKVISEHLGKFTPNNLKTIQIYEPVGCKVCNDSGFTGRTGIFEVMEMNSKLGESIVDRLPEQEIQIIAIQNGMTTMLQDGFMKVIAGETTIEEVLRVAED